MTNDCHENPSQYIKAGVPRNSNSSRVDRSTGILYESEEENPNSAFIHDLKKKVGPSKYKNTSMCGHFYCASMLLQRVPRAITS